jgi:hypothetical protein
VRQCCGNSYRNATGWLTGRIVPASKSTSRRRDCPPGKIDAVFPAGAARHVCKAIIKAVGKDLTLEASGPVKLSLSMEEQFYTISKHATTFRTKSAVDRIGLDGGRRSFSGATKGFSSFAA